MIWHIGTLAQTSTGTKVSFKGSSGRIYFFSRGLSETDPYYNTSLDGRYGGSALLTAAYNFCGGSPPFLIRMRLGHDL